MILVEPFELPPKTVQSSGGSSFGGHLMPSYAGYHETVVAPVLLQCEKNACGSVSSSDDSIHQLNIPWIIVDNNYFAFPFYSHGRLHFRVYAVCSTASDI